MFQLLTTPILQWLQHKPPSQSQHLCDFERIRHEIKPCDVLLIEGRSRVSEVIKLITQSPWSHAALYIGRVHDIEDPRLRAELKKHYFGAADQQLIIESELGVGTIVRPLSSYEHEHIRLCRPKGISFGDSQQLINYAVGRLGATYNVRQIFDLARFLFPWMILPRRWRSSLFRHHPGDSTQTVCSTMIAEAFGEIQFPILPLVKEVDGDKVQLFRRNPKLCTPSDFDYSPYFDIIKYPFLDFNAHSHHRLLPWRGNGSLVGDELDFYIESEATERADPADTGPASEEYKAS